jgi:hypothetical protein
MNVSAAGQTRLVIVGATGMVGGYALRYALDHPAVGPVTAIGRRKVRHLAPQAESGSASRLRGLRCTCGYALRSRCGGLPPGRLGVLPSRPRPH